MCTTEGFRKVMVSWVQYKKWKEKNEPRQIMLKQLKVNAWLVNTCLGQKYIGFTIKYWNNQYWLNQYQNAEWKNIFVENLLPVNQNNV